MKKMVVLTDEDKEWLQQSGVLNADNPLSCVLFANGKNFCFHSGMEHPKMSLSQLQREVVWENSESLV